MPEASWDSLANTADSRFFALKNGPNNYRIVSKDPYLFKKHFFQTSKKSVICPNDSTCLPCQLGMQSTDRFAVVALDLDTNQVGVLEAGKKVRKGIVALHQKSIWGDPRGYDITIEKSGSSLTTDYSVVPGAKQPLSPEQISMIGKQIKDKNLNDLSQVIKPTPIEKVRELLGEVQAAPAVPPAQSMPAINSGGTPTTKQTVNVPDKDRLMNPGQSTDELFKSLNLK